MGRNYLLADIEGRGHYVGTVQSVYHSSPGWYGEGDDFFTIDGAAEPQLRGTGTEDYFCDAWGFRQQDGPFYGTPLWEGYNTGDRSSAYRWHIPDPVTFQKSLRAEIEHKGSQTFPDGKVDGFIERDDLMSSVAFWYQVEPHKPWPELPPGKDRLPFREQTLVVGHALVPVAKHSDAPLETQPTSGATDGKQLWFRPADDKGWLELPFTVEKEMTVELWVKTLHSWDYGTWRVRVDGTGCRHVRSLQRQHHADAAPHRLAHAGCRCAHVAFRVRGQGRGFARVFAGLRHAHGTVAGLLAPSGLRLADHSGEVRSIRGSVAVSLADTFLWPTWRPP